jgi:hypothetical protein
MKDTKTAWDKDLQELGFTKWIEMTRQSRMEANTQKAAPDIGRNPLPAILADKALLQFHV